MIKVFVIFILLIIGIIVFINLYPLAKKSSSDINTSLSISEFSGEEQNKAIKAFDDKHANK